MTQRPRNNIANNIIIDDPILSAISQYMAENKMSIPMLADKINVQKSSVYSWFNEKNKTIKQETWSKIYPLLQPYLPEGEKYMPTITSKHSAVAINGSYAVNGSDGIIQAQIIAIINDESLSSDEKVKFIQILTKK